MNTDNTTERRYITLPDFLLPAEIAKAVNLYKRYRMTGDPSNQHRSYADIVAEEIIRPVIARINETLGQENDPMYMAYCVEYVLGQQIPKR
jgi:hypothetical protein